jgi:hypothetical protein
LHDPEGSAPRSTDEIVGDATSNSLAEEWNGFTSGDHRLAVERARDLDDVIRGSLPLASSEGRISGALSSGRRRHRGTAHLGGKCMWSIGRRSTELTLWEEQGILQRCGIVTGSL